VTVEFSKGYKEQARKRLEELERSMTPQALAVARLLEYDFRNSYTKFEPETPKPCPFCGAKPWMRDNQACGWRIECDSCQIGNLEYLSKDEALRVWNSRQV
jgi:hypothetical protein